MRQRRARSDWSFRGGEILATVFGGRPVDLLWSITRCLLMPQPDKADRSQGKRSRSTAALGVVLVALSLSACFGVVQDPSAATNDGSGPLPPVGLGGVDIDCTAPTFGTSPMRRLTHREYDNAVRNLLNLPSGTSPSDGFAPDPEIGLYDTNASAQVVSGLLAEQYVNSATALARTADLGALIACDRSTPACVTAFAESLGSRAYRRPLARDEIDALVELHGAVAVESEADTGVHALITAVLTSPNFLFRPEFGSDGPASRATSPEVAHRLASFLWASLPDDRLLDLAAANQLATRENIEAEARRMLDDSRARPAIEAFFHQWFGTAGLADAAKNPDAFPDFDDALESAMAEEARRFIAAVLWEEDARLSTMMSAPWTIANDVLASIYGVPSATPSNSFERVSLEGLPRAGLLTQPWLLATLSNPNESSPILRGQWVRERILCHELPPPPPDIPELPPIEDDVSNRERFALHTSEPACAGCHSLIDGIGFGLEEYDGIGRYRDDANLDTSGTLTATADIDGPFAGGVELAQRLASSAQVRACAVNQAFRYMVGRDVEPEDACTIQDLQSSGSRQAAATLEN